MALGYGFFTWWISTFKAFQQESEVKSSCTALWTGCRSRSRAAACWLGTSRTCASTPTQSASRSCARAPMIVRSIPPFDKSWIALIKSPYMLFKGWQRLLHDLIGREGPSLEIVCVPIAGLAILFWPLVVVGSVLLAIVLSIFVGLYGTIIVSRRNHFKGEFHMLWPMLQNSMYTNDWLYIREGIILPKPFYRNGKPSNFRVLSQNKCLCQSEAPAMLVLDSAPARSVREAIQEVKMVHTLICWR